MTETDPYAVVIADPPWTYSDKMSGMKSTGGGASTKYRCNPTDEIMAFPFVRGLRFADSAHLWLWTTNAFMVEAYRVARFWGLDPKTILTWVKGRLAVVDGRAVLVQHICQGRSLRNSTEHVLFASRGKPSVADRTIPTAFVYPGRWKGRKHSEKPPGVVHDLAGRLRPAGRRIELYARTRRDGWDAIGDELTEPEMTNDLLP